MSELAGLVEMANQNTGVMIAFLWLSGTTAYKLVKSDISEVEELTEENGNDIDELASDHQDVHADMVRMEQKQDHVVSRQERMMEQMGMNEQEIRELRENSARMDERNARQRNGNGDLYRGSAPEMGDD